MSDCEGDNLASIYMEKWNDHERLSLFLLFPTKSIEVKTRRKIWKTNNNVMNGLDNSLLTMSNVRRLVQDRNDCWKRITFNGHFKWSGALTRLFKAEDHQYLTAR